MKQTRKLLTLAYVVALLIVASFAVLTHVLVTQVLSEQEGAAEVINVSGRQRMLSQRITLFAREYERSGTSRAQGPLNDAINRMDREHEMLVNPIQGTSFDKLLSPRLGQLYFDEGLDQLVRDFLSMARAIANGESEDGGEGYRLQELAAVELLNKLDRAVKLYEEESDTAIESLTQIQFYALATLLVVLLAEAMLIFRPLVTTVGKQAEYLEKLAHTDELTDMANRRSFNDQAKREVARAVRSGSPLSALVIDLDRFKKINDTYGHEAGDRVLQSCAHTIVGQTRESDIPGRTGGEEFCVLMPDTATAGAYELAQRLLERLKSTDIAATEDVELQMTFSGGIAELGEGENLNGLLHRADLAMYEAKEGGRAQVRVADDAQEEAADSTPPVPEQTQPQGA